MESVIVERIRVCPSGSAGFLSRARFAPDSLRLLFAIPIGRKRAIFRIAKAIVTDAEKFLPLLTPSLLGARGPPVS